MRRVSKFLLSVFVCALAVLPGEAQTARSVRVDFKETTLKNGLRVITLDYRRLCSLARATANVIGERYLAEALQPAGGLLGYISAEGDGDHCR